MWFRDPKNALTAFLIALAIAVGASAYLYLEQPLPEANVSNRPVQVREDGYASSQACRSCHPDEYNTWHASYHRTMTQVATPETARPNFDGTTVVNVHGRPMRLQRRGAQLWAEFDDPDASASPELRPRISRPVVMITGSHNQQIFWYSTGKNRTLGQLPGAYLIREQQWIPRRTAVLHPETDLPIGETGHWNGICIACHATNGKPHIDSPFGSRPADTQVMNTTAAEFGISCEACHGPSEAHVRENRSPLRRYWLHLTGQADTTTVDPVDLKPRQSSQVCGQCHGIWEFYDAAGERHANSSGLPYRPGDDLVTTRFVAQPTVNADSPTMKGLLAEDPGFIRDSFWSDGKVRVSGREYNGLIESPCFRNATDEKHTLTCFSCHTLHKPSQDPRPLDEWAAGLVSFDKRGNEACLQCHEPLRANQTAHTKHAANSAGSLCYNCHMPYTSYGLLKTIRSHTVSSPSVAESTDVGRPNACNLCHLDKTLSWTAEQLERNWGTPRTPLTDDQQTIATGVLWLLQGDAGQRAIAAQAMGRPEAQAASGNTWMAPHLAHLLDDPYEAVRWIGSRSLRTLPGFNAFPYNFVASPKDRQEAQLRVMTVWDRSLVRPGRTDTALLLTPESKIDVQTALRLLKMRDTRRVFLRE